MMKEITELKNKLIEVMMDKIRTEQQQHPEKEEGIMKHLKGFNFRDMAKPPLFDMEPESSVNWSELFSAYMMSLDDNWEKSSARSGRRKTPCRQRRSTTCRNNWA